MADEEYMREEIRDLREQVARLQRERLEAVTWLRWADRVPSPCGPRGHEDSRRAVSAELDKLPVLRMVLGEAFDRWEVWVNGEGGCDNPDLSRISALRALVADVPSLSPEVLRGLHVLTFVDLRKHELAVVKPALDWIVQMAPPVRPEP